MQFPSLTLLQVAMAFSSTCQCFFFFLLLVVATSPLQTHARESTFFSKVTRPEPATANPKPESETISPASSPAKEATPEKGYGLYGEEEKETYQYSPTTTNPTKSAPGKFEYVQPSGANKGHGYHYGAGEKQGMSDTRFLENGRYFYDIGSEKKVENNGKLVENDEGHESYYGNSHENGNRYSKGTYGAVEKQGMSDTRFLENGRYFHDLEAEKNNGERNERQSNNGYSNNEQFYSTNSENEEEEEGEKYRKEGYGTQEKQGMSDTRFLENGRYFYDIQRGKNNGNEMQSNKVYSNNEQFYSSNENENEEEEEEEEEKYENNGHGKQGMNNGYGNNVEFYSNNNNKNYEEHSYEPEKFRYHGSEDQSYSNYEKESRRYNGNGKGYDFRSTPNKFPNYEFDSMEEYEKYEQSRHHH